MRIAIFAGGFLALLVLFAFSGGIGETTQCVSAVAFAPDGAHLAAGMYNAVDAGVPFKRYFADVCRTVEVFPVDTAGPGVVIAREMRLGNQGPLNRTTPAVRFLNRGQHLAALLNNDRLHVWDLNTRQILRSDNLGSERVAAFTYSPDESVVALASGFDASLRTVSNGRELHRIDDVYAVLWRAPEAAFSPDGRYFTNTSFSGTVVVWETRGWTRRHELTGQQNEHFESIAFSADSRLLAVGSASTIRVMDIETGEVKLLPRLPTGGYEHLRQLTFLPDKPTLIGVADSGAFVIDTDKAEAVRRFVSRSPRAMLCAAVSPRGDLLATGDDTGCVTLWDIATGAPMRVLKIDSKFRIPWIVPAALVLVWAMLYRIVSGDGLFSRGPRE